MTGEAGTASCGDPDSLGPASTKDTAATAVPRIDAAKNVTASRAPIPTRPAPSLIAPSSSVVVESGTHSPLVLCAPSDRNSTPLAYRVIIKSAQPLRIFAQRRPPQV
jgi:hypothetical protein